MELIIINYLHFEHDVFGLYLIVFSYWYFSGYHYRPHIIIINQLGKLIFHAINALENMLLFYYVINYSYRDHHDRDIRI